MQGGATGAVGFAVVVTTCRSPTRRLRRRRGEANATRSTQATGVSSQRRPSRCHLSARKGGRPTNSSSYNARCSELLCSLETPEKSLV
jgi:hypothetical protein